MMHLAILRCEKLPSFVTWEIPNLDELFEEDNLLIKGFEAQRVQASSVGWSDPHIDWNQFYIALIENQWQTVILKPTVRLGGSNTYRISPPTTNADHGKNHE